ncbi:cobalt ABC transporter permease [Antarctobacter heliothermus]|uniref:Nickel transport protein n=1 Tax=Antarctobacter heliothermus TaxID=74033 RepID=A0A239IM04_9RHOB|nr:cobalt ABC transporter permease [Antarctobacter heliothermus]SNS94605.1 nickel transport protein [Antarctobacter heliothermus]
MKRLARFLILILTLCALPLPALAHKVIASVFPSGSAIEGEIGFSNGSMAPDLPVQVYGPDGALLGETVTDADGFFLFTPTTAVTHIFRADLGAGHVAETTMPADEVAAVLGVKAPETPTTAPPPVATGVALSAADRAEIARIVRDEMRPLRREIAAYREKNDLQTILGGLGYILGLFGLAFYIAARRRLNG